MIQNTEKVGEERKGNEWNAPQEHVHNDYPCTMAENMSISTTGKCDVSLAVHVNTSLLEFPLKEDNVTKLGTSPPP